VWGYGPLISAVRRREASPTLLQETLSEVLAFLHLAQFLTEKGALVLDGPKPTLGFMGRIWASGEAPLDVARQCKSQTAKHNGGSACEDQLDDVDGIHRNSREW
jgi:hypothetical protein